MTSSRLEAAWRSERPSLVRAIYLTCGDLDLAAEVVDQAFLSVFDTPGETDGSGRATRRHHGAMERLPPEVEAHGVVLRTWAAEEAPELHDAIVASIEHLRPWMPWIGFEPLTVDDRIELIERWERERLAGGDVIFAIRRNGAVAGGAGLHRRIGDGGLEIGYWVHVDHVGQGVATAASRAATDLAFTIDGIDRVEIHHDVANTASARVPEKLGYRRLADVPSPRHDAAPAETGTDGIWRTTCREWRSR